MHLVELSQVPSGVVTDLLFTCSLWLLVGLQKSYGLLVWDLYRPDTLANAHQTASVSWRHCNRWQL